MTKKILISLGLLFVIVLIATILLAKWLFSPLPEIPQKNLTLQEVVIQAKIAGKIFKDLRRRPLKSEATLKLHDSEVQMLLVSSDHITMLMPGLNLSIPLRYYQLNFKQGKFNATIPVDSGHRWFGGYIMIHIEFSLKKDASDLSYMIHRMCISGLPVPTIIAKYFIDNWLKEQQKTVEYQYFDNIVKSIYYTSSSKRLIITYRPAAASEFI